MQSEIFHLYELKRKGYLNQQEIDLIVEQQAELYYFMLPGDQSNSKNASNSEASNLKNSSRTKLTEPHTKTPIKSDYQPPQISNLSTPDSEDLNITIASLTEPFQLPVLMPRDLQRCSTPLQRSRGRSTQKTLKTMSSVVRDPSTAWEEESSTPTTSIPEPIQRTRLRQLNKEEARDAQAYHQRCIDEITNRINTSSNGKGLTAVGQREYLADKRDFHRKQQMMAGTRACEVILEENNRGMENHKFERVDLHGLKVDEAVKEVINRLKAVKVREMRSRGLNKMVIITGTGNTSAGSCGALRTAIRAWLESHIRWESQFKADVPNVGCFTVYFTPKN